MRNIVTPSLENMITVTIMVAVVWAIVGFVSRAVRARTGVAPPASP